MGITSSQNCVIGGGGGVTDYMTEYMENAQDRAGTQQLLFITTHIHM
jgi:hypothetical protein